MEFAKDRERAGDRSEISAWRGMAIWIFCVGRRQEEEEFDDATSIKLSNYHHVIVTFILYIFMVFGTRFQLCLKVTSRHSSVETRYFQLTIDIIFDKRSAARALACVLQLISPLLR